MSSKLPEELRKVAAKLRKKHAAIQIRRTEKKAEMATALLGLELLARRVKR